MSMISGLIDELNKSADEWNSSNMFELARMCRDAADTIWQLRDDLQRANAENAKLRELVADVWGYISHPANATWTHEKRKEVRDSLANRMRELGMEVPDGD